ncbi:TRAP transporter small permease subunit [Rhodospirillaceae bacterium KN72]|uniref:TRAP transporter small permease protein n=1 Tax=Pacificispira spongiicola TaxID=2729598 RepID=A0A7Y0DYL2_9PROT|nr:TRAP transporter small permease subunit [Pacificispira spongiicola]NMM43990.1 TRAP transporter small permease subunit [Pacificispira spongiicola]
MRNFLTELADRIEAAVDCAGRVAQWLVPLFVMLAFAGTILRHAFGLGSVFLQESVLYLHATAFLIGAAVALLADRHVRVDIFYRDASPRRKAIVDMIGGIAALLPFCAVVAYTALPYAVRSWAILEQSRETTGVPLVFLLKSLIVGYAVILWLQGLASTIRNGLRLAEGPS